MITNVDVTLRDGGYRNNFDFPLEYAIKHARECVAAGIEWVEIAYRNGTYKNVPKIGLTGRGEDSFIRTVAETIGPDRICVILHPKNISDDDLPSMYRAGARLIRVCVAGATSLEPARRVIRLAKSIGFTVTANITRVSELDLHVIVERSRLCADAGCDVLYLADSNGSLVPSEAARMVSAVRASTGVEVGLHTHDNLGLALHNAVTAVEAGATWIDSSLSGMGKGPGNLRTEQWLAYLMRTSGEEHYDLGRLLAQVVELRKDIPESEPGEQLHDLILGFCDLSVEDGQRLREQRIPEAFETALQLAAERAAR